MDPKILKELVIEQNREFNKEEDFVRRTELDSIGKYLELPHILIISGIRRVGKSTLLKEIKKSYFEKQTIYYFNFEDERLISFSSKDLNQLYETFLEVFKKSKTFFFDEIQNIPGWENFVRRMYNQGFKFIITGSNSSLLSRELGSKLTGRYIKIELFPFSFKEYCEFNNVKIKKPYLTEKRAKIKKLFNNYLKEGGIPEYLKYKNEDILKTLYENILYKDILVRYNLNEEKTLKELSSYLFSNYGKEYSYNKLKKLLRRGSQNTVKNYIDYMENSYLAFTIPKYDYSLKKQIYSNKKIYVIDSALINLISFNFSRDIGRILENTVLIELKRRRKEIYYYRYKHECDFLIKDKGRISKAIQVTKSFSENREREINGLTEAMKKYKLKQGLILTQDEEAEERIGKYKIIIKPVWKYLLEE